MATTKEILREARSELAKKIRAAAREDRKAESKAYGRKMYGNISKHRKGSKSPTAPVDGGVEDVGRETGGAREGGQAPDNA